MNEELQPESTDSGEEPAYAERDKAALEDKGALKPCEACGGEFRALGLRMFFQSVDDDDTMRRGVGTGVTTAICSNCGLLRFHYPNLLHDEWSDDD